MKWWYHGLWALVCLVAFLAIMYRCGGKSCPPGKEPAMVAYTGCVCMEMAK